MFIGAVDVLSILLGKDRQWVQYRGERFGEWLESKNITHRFSFAHPPKDLEKVITHTSTKVVINEAMSAPPDTIRYLAKALPSTKFVNLFHGAPAYCCSFSPEASYDFIRMSRDCDNVFVGVVSDPESQAWLEGAKVVHLPNLVQIPRPLHGLPPATLDVDGPLCVSLLARPWLIKNWGGMVSAIGILSKRRRTKALVFGKIDNAMCKAHLSYLEDLGIDAEIRDFSNWEDTLKEVHQKVHVGLACGYSDSLNLVAAEHCLLGIPVVGSAVLDWLPRDQRVCPQDPVGMADAAEKLVSSPVAGKIGQAVAQRLARLNETTLLQNLRGLLSS